MSMGVPIQPLAACSRRALLGEGSPPSSTPCWPHTLSTRCHSGGFRFSSVSSSMLRARSARCLVRSPNFVSL